MTPCPCCSGLSYSNCCEPYHKGRAAPTALALMRSRYSAYTLGLSRYIIETTHPKNPSYKDNLKTWEEDIRRFSQDTQFVKLEIEGHGKDWVSFTARLAQNGRPLFLRETSRFAQIGNRWFYLSGVISTEAKP